MKYCLNQKCLKDLNGTSDRRFYCDDKCRSAYDYSKRKKKVELADGLLASLELRKIYKGILSELLGSKKEHRLPINHLILVGIDLDNLIFKTYILFQDDTHLFIDFDQYSIDVFHDFNLVIISIDDTLTK